FVAEEAPRRAPFYPCCQGDFIDISASISASISANARTGGGMKLCPPVDFQFAILMSPAPCLHGMPRKVQGGRVLAKAHSAPVQRFQVHRPEGLNGAATRVRPCAETYALPLAGAAFFEVPAGLFTAQIGLIFFMFPRLV